MARGVGGVFGLAALLTVSAATLAQGGRFSLPLDVLSQLAPLYVAIAMVLTLIAFAARLPGRAITAGASGLAIALSGLLMAPELLRSVGPQAPPNAQAQLKVIQLNALKRNVDLSRVADWLISEKPDIVTIAEARHDLRDLLVRRTGWRMAGAHGNLIVFTREPYVRMDRPRPPAALSTHFVNATYATTSGPLELVSARHGWPTDPTIGRQRAGLEWVIARLPRQRMILTGDFNATPWSAGLQRLDRNLGLIRRDRAVATWPAQVMGRPWPLPFLPIDHVYAGPGWATVRVERGPWVGSDHYPLVVTLAPVSPR